MRAFYSDQFVLPLPAGHRFPMAKYRLLRDRLQESLPAIALHAAEPATDGELALVHTPAYIEAVRAGGLSASMQRDIGFPWSPAMVERSRRSAGATVMAARSALFGASSGMDLQRSGHATVGEGVAANLAGGTHHAYADRGGGFCVFNDAAVAARLMQVEWFRHARRVLPVAIVDLDVHQGNGTARIFAGDDSVFTLSLHGARNFPFAKEQSDLDVALPDGCDDVAYLEALDQALQDMASRFEPGLVIYLAGADPHEGDRLGRLRLSFDGLEARDRRVFDWAWQRRIPLAMAMGGGYGRDLQDTVRVQVNTYRVALAYWQRWQNQHR